LQAQLFLQVSAGVAIEKNKCPRYEIQTLKVV